MSLIKSILRSTNDLTQSTILFNIFHTGKETIHFIRAIDRLFDFLNSRNPFGKGFKKPLYRGSIESMKTIIMPIIEYLLSLTDVKGIPLYLTPRKTFLIGKCSLKHYYCIVSCEL